MKYTPNELEAYDRGYRERIAFESLPTTMLINMKSAQLSTKGNAKTYSPLQLLGIKEEKKEDKRINLIKEIGLKAQSILMRGGK